MKLVITRAAAKDILKLPDDIGRRIVQKMQWYAAQDNPLSFATALKNSEFGSHRFRIGKYRVLVEIHKNHISILLVLAVKHRKEAYQL